MGSAAAPILNLEHVEKRFGATVVANNLSLSVMEGEFFTFLGPSGSGKSTILRIVAGLENPDSGRVLIAGHDVSMLPPWERNLGMMFQQYAIFPHMTVAANIAYGLKVRGVEKVKRAREVERLLGLVGLVGMGGKRATRLSGGEQQRVALARALAPEPNMLLLDEPLSALDERTRRLMQAELKVIHRDVGTTFLYVTHDQEEALTMSDRIAVLNDGIVVQCDVPKAIYKRPRTRFVANFFRGCNVLTARKLDAGPGRVQVLIAGRELVIAATEQGSATELHLALRAENVHLNGAEEGHRSRFSAQLVQMTYRGALLDYRLRLEDGQELTALRTEPAHLARDGGTFVSIDPNDLVVLAD